MHIFRPPWRVPAGGMVDTQVQRKNMTLIEVVLAIVIAAIAIGGLLMSLFMAGQSTLIASQYSAAMQLCLEVVEEMRAGDFDEVNADNFPAEEEIPLTVSDRSGNAFLCDREIEISDESTADMEAKRVRVLVRWRYRGIDNAVPYETIIYKFH